MKLAAVLALPFLVLSACVTSSNLCAPGYVYVAQGEYCVGDDAGSGGPGDAAKPGAAPTADAGSSAPGDAGGDASSTGLGTTCNADSDCTGAASYCLKDPTAPTSPGYCSLTHCTAAACTSAYSCCDCTASSLPPLKAYPPGICAPTADQAQLTALGCTCQ